jgi:hypothetical protein
VTSGVALFVSAVACLVAVASPWVYEANTIGALAGSALVLFCLGGLVAVIGFLLQPWRGGRSR